MAKKLTDAEINQANQEQALKKQRDKANAEAQKQAEKANAEAQKQLDAFNAAQKKQLEQYNAAITKQFKELAASQGKQLEQYEGFPGAKLSFGADGFEVPASNALTISPDATPEEAEEALRKWRNKEPPFGPPRDSSGEVIDPQVIVYGPDGTEYPSPGAARRAGVTTFTFEKPKTGDNNVATQTTKGKTGEELETATADAMASQADPAASTLPDGAKIVPVQQIPQANEFITAPTLGDAPQVAPPVLVTSPEQSTPESFDAATYQASLASPQIGEAEAARGKLSEEAQVQAAQGTLRDESLAVAATQELDERATTQYQLGQLMDSIESGGPLPPWASPAVRRVNAIMQQRGLGSSSMAAAAITQAVMESGIPIAQQDANKYATIQLQNLNNEQQAALQNAAAQASLDMANLNNRQQAAVANAKSFLSIDLQNLTNEQQSNTITFQSKVQGYLSDAAAENVAKQFGAKEENEVKEFFTELGANIETANIQRAIAVEQFNSSQTAALEQFNAQMSAQYEQFNANLRLEIDQSNAIWRRTVNTQNTARQNEANRQNALNLLGIQQNALNNLWQLYRDKAAWTMQISENEADRAHNAAMQAASFSENASIYDEKFDDFLIIKTIDNIFG